MSHLTLIQVAGGVYDSQNFEQMKLQITWRNQNLLLSNFEEIKVYSAIF